MGRRNKTYSKTLHQQIYDRLTSMQAFGESKRDAAANGTMDGKIFSYATYKSYYKQAQYFARWIQCNHPECTTLKSARKYVNDYLESQVSRGLSAWTIHTQAKALSKLYGIKPTDADYFTPPERCRADIKRSRDKAEKKCRFSERNNAELVAFCRGTGCRRGVLEKLRGDDLWSRSRMTAEVASLENKTGRSEAEEKHLACLKEALQVFPDQDWYVHHRHDKNGKYRYAPIMGTEDQKSRIIARFQDRRPDEKVWQHVSKAADIHGYRSDYAVAIYRRYARNIEDIPYDRVMKGTGKRLRRDIYACRNDENGRKLDRRAMKIASKALGHSREYVIAVSYLRGL